MSVSVTWSHEQHRDATWCVIAVPAATGDDHKVAGAERARDLTTLLAKGELTLASENVKKLVTRRM